MADDKVLLASLVGLPGLSSPFFGMLLAHSVYLSIETGSVRAVDQAKLRCILQLCWVLLEWLYLTCSGFSVFFNCVAPSREAAASDRSFAPWM